MSRMPNKRDVQAAQPPPRRDVDRVEDAHDTIGQLADEPMRENADAAPPDVDPAEQPLHADDLTNDLSREEAAGGGQAGSEGAGSAAAAASPQQPLAVDELTDEVPREEVQAAAGEDHAVQLIPAEYRDLFDSRPVLVSLATVQANSQPHVNPVWIDMEGDFLRVNTVKGRQKYVNMVERPMVTIMAFDPDSPLRYAEVRGRVHHITEEGGSAHIDRLAKKYLGVDVYPWHIAEDTRVIVYIQPIKVLAQG